MGPVEGGSTLRVSVAYSAGPGEFDEVALSLPAGSVVADALAASGLEARHSGLALARATVGVWGVACELERRLQDRDRVEVYRPLTVDPMEARRRRERAQRPAKR